MKVYKVPKEVDINDLLKIKGEQGSTLLPMEDINGNMIISEEEWKSEELELQKRFENTPFEEIEYQPKPIAFRRWQ